MGRWEGLRAATDLKRSHPWAVLGTLLGGVGAISGAVVAALALFVNDGTSGPVTPPTTTTTSRVKLVPPKYTYRRVVDDTGALSVSIPKQWRTVYGDGWHIQGFAGIDNGTYVGPGINAAPSIAKWNADKRTPGFFVGASKLVARKAPPRTLLTKLRFDACDAGPFRPITTDAKAGGSVFWTCPGTPTRWYTSAWWPPKTHAYAVYLQVKLTTSSDDEALQQILETLTVRPARI